MDNFFTSLKSVFYKVASVWENPFWAGAIALIIYLAYALHINPSLGHTLNNYHNYLADAFLHGQLNLRLIPPNTQMDLSQYNQKFYLYWPPMPALLLMPFVVIFSVNFSDVLFTLAIAVINVSLVAILLQQLNNNGIAVLTRFQRSMMVLFFAFGTVHFTVAPYGTVWMTSSAVGFFFSILAYLSAISFTGGKGFFFTGLFVACAALTRNTLLFVGIWPFAYLLIKSWNEERRRLLYQISLGILPLLVMGISFLTYNWMRFGDWFEIGLKYQNVANAFYEDIQTYGSVSFQYLKRNLYYHFVYYPLPETAETLMGGSLFLLSPVFFAAFIGVFKGRPRISVIILLITIFSVYLPISMLFGTGWFQFGPRYTLDFTVPLLILTAMGLQYIPDWLLVVLSMISAAHFYKGMSILNMIWRR